MCPRCGSILYRNKWVLFEDLGEFIKKNLFENQRKLLDVNAKLEDVEVLDEWFYENTGVAKTLLRISLNEISRTVPTSVKLELSKKTCPNCIKSITGSYRVLIQFRADGRSLDEKEIRVIDEILSNPLFIESIIERREVRHGIDVKVSSLPIARAIVKRVANRLNVKITETFKSKKFDSQRGVWIGETVLSLRIPSISKDAIVEYSGEFWVVRETSRDSFLLESLETGRELRVDLDQYWKGFVKVVSNLDDFGTARFVGYDSTTLYLLNESSGEIIEMPRKSGEVYSEGERFYIVRLGDRSFLVRAR